MPPVLYVAFSVLGIGMLGLAGFCSSNAGRDHLSPWWLGTYASLLTAFALLASTTSPAAVAAAH